MAGKKILSTRYSLQQSGHAEFSLCSQKASRFDWLLATDLLTNFALLQVAEARQ